MSKCLFHITYWLLKKNAFFNFNFKLVFVFIKFAFFRDLSRDERGGTDDARVNFLTEINSNSKIKSSIDKNHDLTPDNDGSLFKLVEFMILIVQFILCLTKNKMAFCEKYILIFFTKSHFILCHHNITVLTTTMLL